MKIFLKIIALIVSIFGVFMLCLYLDYHFNPLSERTYAVIQEGSYYYFNGRKYVSNIKTVDPRLQETAKWPDYDRGKIPFYGDNSFKSYLFHDSFYFTIDDPDEYQLIYSMSSAYAIYAVDIVVPSIDELYPKEIEIRGQTYNESEDDPFCRSNIDTDQVIEIIDAIRNKYDVRKKIEQTLSAQIEGSFYIIAYYYEDFMFPLEIYREDSHL